MSLLQALPDLVKFMDSLHNRMMAVHKLNSQLDSESGGFAKEAVGEQLE